tara:strand:+ start:324 stop:2672 length:2349 start_codon:yes stop_codon:yes gene_type:complete
MATNTAASFTNHTGNNTAGPFSISFSYLDEAEVDVTVDGVLKTKTTHYTFPSATTISFTTGNHPANGAAIKFQRDTDISAKKVDFQDGSVLTESDLDTNSDQILFGLQEFIDVVNNDVVKKDGSQVITGNLVFEGSTDNAHETTLAITDPTADRTITLPDSGGTVLTTDSTIVVNSAMIIDGSIVNADINASAAIAGSKIAAASGSAAGSMSSSHFTKLEGIEASATADQTGAEIKTAYENESNTNAYTDAEKTKLAAIEASATADQTGAEIKSAYEAQSDTNAYTDAEKTKLSGIAASADVTSSKNLADLANVHNATPTDGQVLKWINSNSRWEPAADATSGGGGGGTLSDGDKGDITVSSSGAVWTVDAAAITLGKLADESVDESRLKISNTPTDGQYLKYLNSSSQLTWADGTGSSPTTTQGDIIFHNGTNDVRLAKGTAGQVLKMNTGATAPEWVTTAGITNGDKGDITVANAGTGSEAWTIDNDAVDQATIADNAVGSDQIAADAVTGAKIADNAIDSEHYVDGSIDHVHLANDAVDGDNIADDAINSEHYVDGSIDTAHIAADQITGALIADDAVGAEHIEDLDATVKWVDNAKAIFGTGADLEVFHDGSHSYIHNSGTGNLQIKSDGSLYLRVNDTEESINCNMDGSVELFHNNVKELTTKVGGVKLFGHSESIVTALTSASSVTIDFSLSNHFSCTMGHNITFANPTTESVGQSGTIVLTQDGTGSRTAAWGSQFLWAGGTAPTLSTGANAVDRIDYFVAAADKIHCVASLAVA